MASGRKLRPIIYIYILQLAAALQQGLNQQLNGTMLCDGHVGVAVCPFSLVMRCRSCHSAARWKLVVSTPGQLAQHPPERGPLEAAGQLLSDCALVFRSVMLGLSMVYIYMCSPRMRKLEDRSSQQKTHGSKEAKKEGSKQANNEGSSRVKCEEKQTRVHSNHQIHGWLAKAAKQDDASSSGQLVQLNTYKPEGNKQESKQKKQPKKKATKEANKISKQGRKQGSKQESKGKGREGKGREGKGKEREGKGKEREREREREGKGRDGT